MAKIQFIHNDDTKYVLVKELNAAKVRANSEGVGADARHTQQSQLSEEEQLSQEIRFLFTGGPDSLQLFEIRVQPGARGQAHAHVEDEIMYVLEGDIEFGNRSFPAGSAISIPGNTLYSFRAGPKGLRFLNFRARADFTYIGKDEFTATRKAARASSTT